MEIERLLDSGYSPAACKLYMALCAKANWKDGKWITGNGEIHVSVGDLITSQFHLSEIICLSRDKTRTALEALVRGNFVTQETTKTYTRIHIVKYCGNEKYVMMKREKSPRDAQEIPTIEDVKTLDEDKRTPIAGPYKVPDKVKDPAGNLVIAYKLFKKIPKDDRLWDKTHFGRAKRATTDLISICGCYQTAFDCLGDIALMMDKKGLSWTIETVVKHSHEWKLKRSHKNAELENRKGVLMAPKSVARITPENTRGGGLVSAGEILARIPSLPIAWSGAERSNEQ